MDKADRARYKQLAIDTIIASPVHSEVATLAEALEKCIDELERLDQSPHCATCNCHGVPI